MFRSWGAALPPDIEVCALMLPGREALLRERPLIDLEQIVEYTLAAVRPYLDRPFALFGHSMGSWVAFELVRRLRNAGLPAPLHLLASGRRAPPVAVDDTLLHRLPDGELLEEIQRRYGGIPAAVLNEPELLALLLPALRADLTALETYRYRDEPPLECPISTYGGFADPQVPLRDLEAWRPLTAAAFAVRQFPGGHFYLQEEGRAALLTDIEMRLREPAAG
jgi:medium-chain acyl-[acyl-carrier-protein] hydrolase